MNFAWTGCDCSICRNLNIWNVVLDESGTDEAKFRRKLASGRRVAGAVRSLFNARGPTAWVLRETLLVPVLCKVRFGMRRRLLELGLYR